MKHNKSKNLVLLFFVLIGLSFITYSPMLQPAQATSPQLLWSNISQLSNSSATQLSLNPSIATDSQGNIHIVWAQEVAYAIGEVFYTKLDKFGNTIISNRQLSNFSGINGFISSMAIDKFDNIHIVWDYDLTGTSLHGTKYTRLYPNGTIAVNGVMLLGTPTGGPQLAVDSYGNIIVAWRSISYGKFDNMGNVLIPVTLLGNSLPLWDPLDIKIALDSNDTTYITWMEEYALPSSNPDSHIKYSKILNNGSIIANDIQLDVLMSHSYNPAIAIDKEDDVFISWDSDFNGGNIYLSKIAKNGTYIFDRMPVLNGTNFGNAAILVDSLDHINIIGRGGFTQLDKNGDVIINPTITGTTPLAVALDRQGNMHLVWSQFYYPPNSAQVKYRKSLNPATIFMQGNPRQGSKVKFKLQDIYNINGSYVFALSTGVSQGINLPDGRKIPLDNDWLFSASISSPQSVGLSRSTGILDINNQASVTLAVPIMPSLRGTTIYGAFLTYDFNGRIVTISDAINFTIL